MSKWIVKNFALSYDSKFAGNVGRHPRAVNYTITMLALAIIIQGFLDVSQWWALILLYTPFAVCIYLGFFYFRLNPISYAEVEDWEQKYMFLKKPDTFGNEDETFPFGVAYQKELAKYGKMYNDKYRTDANFVEAKRIIYPFAVIIVLGILYSISQ
jgi:hypothetical protein